MSDTVLIVEDDTHIAELIALYARNAGFVTRHAVDGARGLEMALAEPPALVVLDLMLPALDGWEVCRRIRAQSAVPIVMLTAMGDDVDKIVGLELGADDYLTKPFNPRELIARIRAILRRGRLTTQPHDAVQTTVTLGPLHVDPARREARIVARDLALRAKEFDLLWFFAQHPGLVFSRERLLERVWGFDFAGETRTVDVHVAQLRKRLGDPRETGVEIETVFGVGYRLRATVAPA